MNTSETALFLLILGIMLLLARGLGEMFRAIKQPMIIGEILAGIILGPTVLGMLAPDIYNQFFTASAAITSALNGLAMLGVVLLLIVSGLEVDLGVLIRQSKVAGLTSITGIAFTFAAGFGLSYLFPAFLGMAPEKNHLIFSVFIGTALSITALPVVAKILMDLKLFKSEIGFTVIAAAMLNDITGWIIFSILIAQISDSSHGFSPQTTVLLMFTFLLVTLVFGRKLFNRILPVIQKKFSFPGSVLNFIFIAGLAGAAFTEYIGIHAIFGAFIVGIAIGDSAHLKEETREIIQQFVTNIFAPLFFVSIGLRVNFILNFDFFLTLTLIVVATASKVTGSALGARAAGMGQTESMAVGFGMNAHGAMEIILGLLALEYGLIGERTFVALVIMAIVTSVISGPLMSVYAERLRKLRTLKGLLSPASVYITEARTKDEVIRELCKKAAARYRTDETSLRIAVLAREESSSTGLVNGLALPHARITVKEPLILCALSQKGIEFDSMDRKPSHIIFLLITPLAMPELQLQLLSDIAKPFDSDELALAVSKDPGSFYALLSEKIT